MRSPDSSLTVVAVLCAFAAAVMFATTTVTVDEGDTLSLIAAENDVTVAELVEWNGIDDPDRIFSGDLLVVVAPSASPSARGGSASHVVTAGETLSMIAARYGASVAVLAEANGLEDPDRIRAGAVLTLAATPSPSSNEPVGTTTHVVLPGDTLWAIASKHGVSVENIVATNELTDEDHIVSGQTLRIGTSEPTAESIATTTTTTVPPTATVPPPTTTVPPTTTTAPLPTPTFAPEATDDDGDDEPLIPRPSMTQTPLADAFERWASSYGVPQDLLEAIAWHASDWQPSITGPDGRLGIGQLSPEAVELVETRLLGLDLDPLATSDGVRLAARYLRYLIDRTHSDREALIAWQIGLSPFLDGETNPDAERWADAVLEIRRMRA